MTEPATEGLKLSPLHDRQLAAGAKFAAFGGWSMPLEYAGGGVLAEHTAVRTAVGLFDVSHLGKVVLTGRGAYATANRTLTNDLGKVGPGHAQYTLLCTDAGGVVDDLIAYLKGPEDLLLIPNAANAATVAQVLTESAADGTRVVDRHRDFAVLAVQGPASDAVLRDAGLPSGHPYMAFVGADVEGAPVTVCRTGYTGERGYELVAPAEVAGHLWDRLLAAGRVSGIRPAGLGARDTLRTEMGYPLHGQDLSPEITPVQARLGWAVGWRKDAFRGDAALRAERNRGPARTLRGLRAEGRGIPRPGMTVRDTAGSEVGQVTSGTFSPTLRTGIALALVDTGPTGEPPADGEGVLVDVRARREPFRLTKPPFVQPAVREP